MRPGARAGLLLVTLGVGLLAVLPPSSAQTTPAVPAPANGDANAELDRGLALYARHCATCHGATGRGDGPAAYLLYPKPRDFGGTTFRLVSGEYAMPTDADLRGAIDRGMPGSAMPPWNHLAEADRDALVAAVRHFMLETSIARIVASGADDGDGVPRDEAEEEARDELDPGDVVEIPPEAPITPEHLARGRALYEANCAHCHDQDGRGLRRGDLVDSQGVPIFARDFTKGVFKGGSDGVALARRITLGMPGTPMPETAYDGEELWALVHLVQTMIDEDAQERVTQRRSTIVARRVDAPLGADPDDPAWSGAQESWIVLMPLWWRPGHVEGVRVAALHDGRRLALRLSWDDATADDEVVGQTSFGDAAAVQLAAAEDPPFFGMGAVGGPVGVWQWKAVWQRDLRDGWVSLADVYANMPAPEDALPGAPRPPLVFATGRDAGNPLSLTARTAPVETATARGLGTLASRPPAAQDVRGGGTWRDGRWEVVFVRELGDDAQADTPPRAGGVRSIAFAVWDGGAGDRNGQKSVSIWHGLELED